MRGVSAARVGAALRARLWQGAFGLLASLCALAVLAWGLNFRDEAGPADLSAPFVARPGQVERGAYLARAGNCEGCHTPRGGPAYAGGRAVDTPFGSVVAPNLTPDPETGLGAWSAGEFWRALHNGRGRDGRLLVPAFPYPSYTLVTREDADAIYAYLRSLAPVRRPRAASSLRFPFDTPLALGLWRALYFGPGVFAPDAQRADAWNRGAYLVRGLGHCEACHTARNALGGPTGAPFGGGALPGQRWFAPPLGPQAPQGGSNPAAFVDEMAELLGSGVNARHAVIGPMADVVAHGTQYLTEADRRAMALFLAELPPAAEAPAAVAADAKADADRRVQGAAVYRDHCAACHGAQGEGVPRAYPRLAGNRAVTHASPANLVQAIVGGGYPPSTAANPRPFGMPPFAGTLDDAQIAAVATYVRQAWGNRAGAVSTLDVLRAR